MPNSCPSTWYQCVFLSPTLRNLYSVDFRWSLGACFIIFFFTHSSNSYLCKWSSDFPTWWSTVFKSSLCNEQCYFFVLGDSPFQLIGSAEPHARDEGEWADGVIHRGAFFPPYPETMCSSTQNGSVTWIKPLMKVDRPTRSGLGLRSNSFPCLQGWLGFVGQASGKPCCPQAEIK